MQNLYKNTIFIAATSLIFGCSEHKTAAPAEKFAITDSLINRLLIDTVQQANSKTELMFSAKITANEERRSELFPW